MESKNTSIPVKIIRNVDGSTLTLLLFLFILTEQRYDTIDGPGGVLGTAGPRHYRIKEGLPITGEMRFDLADISRPVVNVLGVIVSNISGVGCLEAFDCLSPVAPYRPTIL